MRGTVGQGAAAAARLASLLTDASPGARARKQALLEALPFARFRRARDVVELQRLACFLIAFPDDARVLRAAKSLAAALPDLVRRLPRAERDRLDDTGIAGTCTRHVYAVPALRWLVARYGANVEIDWAALTHDQLAVVLDPVLHPIERESLEIAPREARAWFARAGAASTREHTALAWLLAQKPGGRAGTARVETALDAAEVQIAWNMAATSASITHNRLRTRPVLRADGMRRADPDASRAVTAPLQALARVSRAHATRVLDVWRAALWSRTRTVTHIEQPNLDECYLADFGGGLQMAMVGMAPAARGVLEASFAYLLLANGMPFGYGAFTPVFAQANTGTNVFPEFRGSEAAFAFQQALRAMHALAGSERFIINPYQFGAGNDEALQSGAYWFYFRLGFRSVGDAARALAQREFERLRTDRAYRVPLPTLRKLAACDMVLDVTADAAAKFFDERKLAALADRVAPMLAATGLADRAQAMDALATSVAQTLEIDPRRWTRTERQALALFAPVLRHIDDLARWPRPDRAALAELVRARCATHERDYVHRLRRHDRLRRALDRALTPA